jgi:tetratricopeptide (TPR) repeat protein
VSLQEASPNASNSVQEASDLVNKGTDLYFEGKKDEAIRAYDEAVKIDPSMAGAYYSKGVAYCSGT